MAKDPCGIGAALEVIGGKWRGQIIWWLKDKPRRFNELRRLMPDITQHTLTAQLRALERFGLVERQQFNELPLRVEYSKTALCASLIPVLDQLRDWGTKHFPAKNRA
jgi:DNA-binding HxlR family transcriptional regulator